MAPALQQEVNLSRRACGMILNGLADDYSDDNNLMTDRFYDKGRCQSIDNKNYINGDDDDDDDEDADDDDDDDDDENIEKLPSIIGANYQNFYFNENSKVSQFFNVCKNNNDNDANDENVNKKILSKNFCSFLPRTSVKSMFNQFKNKFVNCDCSKSMTVFLVLLGVLLLSAENVLARPNRSTTSDSSEVLNFNAPERQLTSPELSASYPGINFGPPSTPLQTQSKRSAEILNIDAAAAATATTTTNNAIGTGGGDSVRGVGGGGGAKSDIEKSNIVTENVISENNEHSVVDRYPVASIEFERVETPFIIGIWILSASIAKIGFHMTPKLNKMFPESCLLIVVGVIIGVVLFFATKLQISPLTPNTFFFYMLPPIILDAGYFMPNRLFFDNIGTILLMAVVGTIFNIATIGTSLWACGLTGIFGVNTPMLDIFLFSSLISAVDPVAVLAVFEEIHVNEILYIVVFGESLLNDAVTVVLYHMFEAYNLMGVNNIAAVDIVSGVASFFVVAVGGTIIGVIWGFLTGLVTRFTDHVRVIEPIFIFVMAYLAYLNAEIFHMSGILAITFCGITMKNYVEANISHKSHTTVKYALKMLSSSAETIIFMFLGVATVNNRHEWNTWFIILTILFCSVFRIIGVIILTALANRFRLSKLSNVDQFVMSYGGLRGAVAFALVLLIDPSHVKLQPMFVTTTIAVIYFTVFLQGITIKPLVKLLKVKRAEKKKPTMNERIHERFMDHMMAGLEDIVGKTGNYNVRDKFKRFDNRFIRPYLIRDLQGPEPKILETYSKLTMRDAMDFMRRNPSTIGQMTGTESMSALFRNYTGYFGGRFGNSFFNTCPSFSNLENSSRNLDMQELDYNPSKKDLTDAKIHHLLAEELKPRRHRRLSYSRHAVDDRDLSTQQVNYKMHMNIRRMVNDRKHHKRSKRLNKDGSKQNHVSFPEFQQNGSAKQLSHDYINEVLHETAEDDIQQQNEASPNNLTDDWDDGLTFTAKSSPDSDRANNNSLIAHITSLPGFDSSKARIVKHYASSSKSSLNSRDTLEIVPTAAETILPWRRDRSYQNFGENDKNPGEDKRQSKDSEGEERVTTPTATESVLPWKREDEGENGALKQNEFPAWASNKEYLAYNSPSATFLGGLNKPKQAKSVIGLFRRESSGSGTAPGSDSSIQLEPGIMTTPIGRAAEKRSQSVCAGMTLDGGQTSATGDPLGVFRPNTGPFPVTASHRRNNRRGSMLEMSGDAIPEENNTKSLPDREKWGGERRGPSLLKMTPKAQHRNINPQATALLSNSCSDTEDEDDYTENGHRNSTRT